MAALADDGYLIASFDNRGTPSPKGRAWRKVIYGSVGVLASEEQAAALRALAASHPYVDLTRAGVFRVERRRQYDFEPDVSPSRTL